MKLNILLLMIFAVYNSVQASTDPAIKKIICSDIVNESGDYFRSTVRNSEINACITIEKINLRGEKPLIKESHEICAFDIGNLKYSLNTEFQDFSLLDMKWNEEILQISAEYVPTGSGSPRMLLTCDLDASSEKRRFTCLRSR